MNLKQLTKQLGKHLRLRPLPIRVDAAGSRLAPSDDSWRLAEILDQPNRIRLVNIHTHHFVELQPDNVKEFRSPDFLLLRCHLIIRAAEVRIEPILPAPTATHVQNGLHAVEIRGDPLRLLGYCVTRESSRLFDWAEADEAIEALGLTPRHYKDAAEELAALGLVTIHHNLNHASGIGRTVLHPPVFLSAGQHLLPDVNLRDELNQLLALLGNVPDDAYRIRVPDLLQRLPIPHPRLDLMLRALEGLDYIVGHGPGHYDWGSSLDIEITPLGRRLLRGEEPLPL